MGGDDGECDDDGAPIVFSAPRLYKYGSAGGHAVRESIGMGGQGILKAKGGHIMSKSSTSHYDERHESIGKGIIAF